MGCRQRVQHGRFNTRTHARTHAKKKPNKTKIDDEATKCLVCLHRFRGSDVKWGMQLALVAGSGANPL